MSNPYKVQNFAMEVIETTSLSLYYRDYWYRAIQNAKKICLSCIFGGANNGTAERIAETSITRNQACRRGTTFSDYRRSGRAVGINAAYCPALGKRGLVTQLSVRRRQGNNVPDRPAGFGSLSEEAPQGRLKRLKPINAQPRQKVFPSVNRPEPDRWMGAATCQLTKKRGNAPPLHLSIELV